VGRPVGQRLAVGTGQEIERDQQRGCFFRQFLIRLGAG